MYKHIQVIAPSGKAVPAITTPRGDTTKCISCVNAIGNAVPPFLVFKGKRFNQSLLESALVTTNFK